MKKDILWGGCVCPVDIRPCPLPSTLHSSPHLNFPSDIFVWCILPSAPFWMFSFLDCTCAPIYAFSACLLEFAENCLTGWHVTIITESGVLKTQKCPWKSSMLRWLNPMSPLLLPPQHLAWLTGWFVYAIFVRFPPRYKSRVWWRHGWWWPCTALTVGFFDAPFFSHFMRGLFHPRPI